MGLFDSPATMDQFTRYMANMFDENAAAAAVSTCYLPFFGDPAAGGSQTIFSPDKNVCDIDIIRGNEKYAKMRLRGVSGSHNIGDAIKPLKLEKYSSISRVYPMMEDFFYIGADQLLQRTAGENPYEMNATKQSRLRALAVRGSSEIIRRFVRGFNKLAGQSLFDGVQDVIFGTSNTDLQYDFYRNTDMFLTVANAWDTANATILADLDTICDRARENGRVTPDGVFTSGEVVNAIISDSEIQSIADNRRYFFTNLGTAGDGASAMPTRYQKFVDSGWDYRGFIQTPKGRTLYLFSTTDIVEEDNGDSASVVPSGKALVCSTRARADRHFGPDERLPLVASDQQRLREYFGMDMTALASQRPNIANASALVRPDMFSFGATISKASIEISCQSAPIFAPVHTDAFGVLQGLLT